MALTLNRSTGTTNIDGENRRPLVSQSRLPPRSRLGRSVLYRNSRRPRQSRSLRLTSVCRSWASLLSKPNRKLTRTMLIPISNHHRAAASIPAALNLIIHLFPGEAEQHIALASFGGAGELANVCGFLLGGVLLLASWRWVFWLLPIVCFPMALGGSWLIPSREVLKGYQLEGLRREVQAGSKRAEEELRAIEESEMGRGGFDYVGTFLIVAGAVLTIFGLTDGGESGGW
jgi:hypothetical protein